MTPNATIADATLSHLLGLGVECFVVCAGARNVPLVASLLKVQETNDLRVFHHFDERTASFFSIGLAKREKIPVAVLTTSGTAVAELLPATIEAHYSSVPLILVSADRPPRFRGSGAPQAIQQPGIFGDYVSTEIDIEEIPDLEQVSSWDRRSPLHLNVCFEEPRAEDALSKVTRVEITSTSEPSDQDQGRLLEKFLADPTGLVIIVGELPEEWRKPAERFLERVGVPFWAEATSGLREIPRISKFQLYLEKYLPQVPTRKVLRIGGVPSLRFWRDLEDLENVEVISVSPHPFSGLARRSMLIATREFPSACESIYKEPVIQGENDHAVPLDEEFASEKEATQAFGDHPLSEPAIFRSLSEKIPGEALVFLGNSLPIREWNLAASFTQPHPRAFASRGANGIDGQIATYLGMSEKEEESWGIFGDLTALYDLNAPALIGQLPKAKRRIVIVNNGGGRIFSRLPSMANLPEEEKEVTENRHTTSFRPWAEMWGMSYASWKAGEPFPTDLGENLVLEILPDETATEEFWGSWK